MKERMTLGGIGPGLILLNIPFIVLSIVVIRNMPDFLNLDFFDNKVFYYLGFVLLATGIIFWALSVYTFHREFKKEKLITSGPYSLSRNPIYASLIVFIGPALTLIFHSGMILAMNLVFFLYFKMSIHGERIILERNFGKEYEDYTHSVNELFPFPRFLFKKSVSKVNEKVHTH